MMLSWYCKRSEEECANLGKIKQVSYDQINSRIFSKEQKRFSFPPLMNAYHELIPTFFKIVHIKFRQVDMGEQATKLKHL